MGIPLNGYQENVMKCVDEASGLALHSARHSRVHLDRAWQLKKRDPEMAVLRAITAEEEAATAVLACLRQLQYERATNISFKNHTHKQAVYPFLMAVGEFIGESKPAPPESRLRVTTEEGRARLVLELILPGGIIAAPQPPLHFTVRGLDSRQPVRFERNIRNMANRIGSGTVLQTLQQRAALRNQLLYAQQDGMPKVDGDAREFILGAQVRVFRLLQTFCLIFPYTFRASFVQQRVDAFLLMLGRVEENEIDW